MLEKYKKKKKAEKRMNLFLQHWTQKRIQSSVFFFRCTSFHTDE